MKTDMCDHSGANGLAGGAAQPVRTANGAHAMTRGARAVAGAALILAAVAIWLAPVSAAYGSSALVKILVSTVAIMAGLTLIQTAMKPDAPKVEIDTLQHEIRLVRARGRRRTVLERCRFSELTRVVNAGSYVQLWGPQGMLLAEVAASDRVAHQTLVTALKVAGKL